jgi:hypothetical protein
LLITKGQNIATNIMAKGAKAALPTKKMALPVKAGGGTFAKVLTIPNPEEER